MHKQAWVGVFIAAALSACNFTGQNQHEDSKLELLQTAPADSQVDAERSVALTAEFDAELDPASVDSTTAWIAGPEGNAIPTSVSSEGGRLQLVPAAPLPGGTTYTVNLGSGITGSGGERLGAAKSLRFTTIPQAWQAELTEVSAFDDFEPWLWPDMAADDRGNVLVAWVQTSGLASLVSVIRQDGGTGAWGTPMVFPITSGLVGWPRVFAGRGGDAYLLWTEDGAEGVSVYMTSYRAESGDWSAPSRIDAVPAGTAGVTPLVEANGNITLACRVDSRILVVRYDAAQARWSGPMAVNTPNAQAAPTPDMRLVADGAGNLLLAWVERDDSGDRPIHAARFDVSAGQWTAAQKVSTDSSFGLFPQTQSMALGLDEKGVATMAWAQWDDTSDSHVMASRFDPAAGRWTTPGEVARGSKVNVVVDRAGYATITWHSDVWLFASRLAAGATAWSQPQRIGEQEIIGGWIETTPLAVDIAGNVTAVYARASDGSQISASRFSVDTGLWSAPQSIDAERTETLGLPWGSPAVAVDASGTVTATWLAYRQGYTAAVLAANSLR